MQNHTAESIKSLEGYDIAWVEEAQALSIRSLDLLRPTIRKPGSELWFSWNPTRADDPVDALFRAGTPPPGSLLAPVKYSDNPHFPEVLRVEMEWDRARDPDKHQHVWLGGYQTFSETRVFRELEGGGVRDAGRCALPVRRRLGLRPRPDRCWCAAS